MGRNFRETIQAVAGIDEVQVLIRDGRQVGRLLEMTGPVGQRFCLTKVTKSRR